jgi:hypothetical protein
LNRFGIFIFPPFLISIANYVAHLSGFCRKVMSYRIIEYSDKHDISFPESSFLGSL